MACAGAAGAQSGASGTRVTIPTYELHVYLHALASSVTVFELTSDNIAKGTVLDVSPARHLSPAHRVFPAAPECFHQQHAGVHTPDLDVSGRQLSSQ